MAALTAPIPLPPADLDLFCAADPVFGDLPVLVFYGASTTANSTLNNSRIQAHIFSLAGHQSFARLTVAPTSSLYAAVDHLPAEFQGDEVSRGLAVSLLSYFNALSSETKQFLLQGVSAERNVGSEVGRFDEVRAGKLAAKMELRDDKMEILEALSTALSPQSISWLDLDVFLPVGSFIAARSDQEDQHTFEENDADPRFRFGIFDNIIRSMGSPAMLSTPKLKRAPSRPPPQSRERVLSREAKISLRREMCEFVDTESTYRSKLIVLVDEMAAICRGASPQLTSLFPESLDQIRDLNNQFYSEVQASLDKSEDDAIRDIETGSHPNAPLMTQPGMHTTTDHTGALAFADLLLDWFPRFRESYQQYMIASSGFGEIIGHIMQDLLAPSAALVKDIGEQRLRAALIEPVQRLPRYNLIIDNIIRLLPIAHPALSKLLKARDVIKEICALDFHQGDQVSRTMAVLSSLVLNWTSQMCPRGRLVTAVDVQILSSNLKLSQDTQLGILLLFTDAVLVLSKPLDSQMGARGLSTELDRPSYSAHCNSLTMRPEKHFRIFANVALHNVLVSESHQGAVLHLTPVAWLAQVHSEHSHTQDMTLLHCILLGPYENKAMRLTHEVSQARMEGRFPEELRDGGRWSVRSIVREQDLSAMVSFSEAEGTVGVDKPSCETLFCTYLTENISELGIQGSLRHGGLVQSRMLCQAQQVTRMILQTSHEEPRSFIRVDESALEAFMRELIANLQRRYKSSPRINAAIFRDVLSTMPIKREHKESAQRIFRPISPVKMLSKMLGSQASTFVQLEDRAPSLSPKKLATFAFGRIEESVKVAEQGDTKPTVLSKNEVLTKSPLELLEDTFIAYTLGIRSQSGNVVGRLLRNRSNADELLVNEVYNSLLEDPSRVELAASTSVDVVFAAFEKFLRRGWRERMGPLVQPQVLQRLLSVLEKDDPSAFCQDFKKMLGEMSPQNRRAFARTIRLLSDLLDASGSDGDRGNLMASFAEAITLAGKAHDYVTLLDRLVEDQDILFEDVCDRGGSSGSAVSSLSKTRSWNKGSYGSASSSLRKKFGLGGGLKRENSKPDLESKVSSLIRGWGKKSSQDLTTPLTSPSKISLVRSKSTDTAPLLRLGHQQGLENESEVSLPYNDHGADGLGRPKAFMLSQSQDQGAGATTTANRKKRRSSLSDLTRLQTPDRTPVRSPLQPRNINVLDSSPVAKVQRVPVGRPVHERENSPPKLGSPLKFNQQTDQLHYNNKHARNQSNDIVITASKELLHGTGKTMHANPAVGRGLQPSPPTTLRAPVQGSSLRKLRVQSPKKIRERLREGNQALGLGSRNLQAEIDQISMEMGGLKTQMPHPPSGGPSSVQVLSLLSDRLDQVSQQVRLHEEQGSRMYDDLRHDFDSTLVVADRRARKLEELYREANKENEALYERFNEELAKVLGKVRQGQGVDELRERLTDALKEVGSLKSERAQLKSQLMELESRQVG